MSKATERRERMAERERIHEERHDEARRLWASGVSVREIGRRMGVHHQTARELLCGYDSLPRRRRSLRDRRMAQAAKLSLLGKSLRQISAELGVSHQTVANDLARWSGNDPKVVALRQELARHMRPLESAYATPDFDAEVVSLSVARRKRSGGPR